MSSSGNRSDAARKAWQTRRGRLASVSWFPSEWADDGWSADVDGIVADVWTEDDGRTWEWSVKPSSSRSQWPEVVAVGACRSLSAARSKAAMKALDANGQYPVVIE